MSDSLGDEIEEPHWTFEGRMVALTLVITMLSASILILPSGLVKTVILVSGILSVGLGLSVELLWQKTKPEGVSQ